MAQTLIVPDSAAQLLERWSADLDAMHAAGDIDALRREKQSHADAAIALLHEGSLAAAEQFAILAEKARTLIENPAARTLVRHPAVTEELMERDA
ncbi:hypothetical protein [Microbacterium hominis]|uniref:Uncharacterized protein n=1 Tax=Microbacterium hominis TaxID=162426 RepID=A0A2K9D7D4_9MICO|nr:hypothetical protein [Microbacterium hominis]AUG28792.1 hypothetical protein CXR34_04415 [Microbacterium hominis]